VLAFVEGPQMNQFKLQEGRRFIGVLSTRCYLEPIVEDVQRIQELPYQGLSLEEIREKFGVEAAISVYQLACAGFDCTKIRRPVFETIKTREVIEYRIEDYNRYSKGLYIIDKQGKKDDLLLCQFDIQMDQEYLVKTVIMEFVTP